MSPNPDKGLRTRALNVLSWHHPDKRLSDRYREATAKAAWVGMSPDYDDVVESLLRWASTVPDIDILLWRNSGKVVLRWIRANQMEPRLIDRVRKWVASV